MQSNAYDVESIEYRWSHPWRDQSRQHWNGTEPFPHDQYVRCVLLNRIGAMAVMAFTAGFDRSRFPAVRWLEPQNSCDPITNNGQSDPVQSSLIRPVGWKLLTGPFQCRCAHQSLRRTDHPREFQHCSAD